MLTILSGLLAALSYASSDMFSQRITRETRALTQMVWVLATGVVIILPVALVLRGLPDRGEWTGAGLAALAGVLYFGALFCLLRGLNVGDLGLVSALVSLQGAYLAVAVILLGEPVTPLFAVALALCMVGAVLTSFERACQVDSGRALGAGRRIALHRRPALLRLRRHRLALTDGDSRSVLLLITVPVALLTGSLAVPRALRARAIGAGVLELSGLSLLTITFALGPATVAGVTTTQFGTFAVILGFVVLGERPKPNQWAGIACTIIGVSLLAAVV